MTTTHQKTNLVRRDWLDEEKKRKRLQPLRVVHTFQIQVEIMSRVGKKPISVLDGVKTSVTGNVVAVEGPKGKLSFAFDNNIEVVTSEDGKTITVGRKNDERMSRALHGLTEH